MLVETAGDLGHVRAALVEDQVKAGAQAIPARSEGCDARVAAADLERDGAPRRSPRMTHLCSDRVSHKKRRALIRKPQVGKALSSPPKAGHQGQVS
jgi:hypothetical protein